MTDKPTLVLIDGHSLAYRAFHALPREMTSHLGESTNAAFGFTSMLLQVLGTHHPEHIAVTFDQGTSGRAERYPEYKAHRAEMDDSLRVQMDRIRQIVEAFGIPIYEAEGWEADDVLGTLAAQAEQSGLRSLIVTGDTDAFQLVDDCTHVQTSGRSFSEVKLYDRDRVRERYGVEPSELAQWKGLTGDKSDNIPGVPGIGKKTATRLVQEFGTVEQAIARADEIAAARARENLLTHADQALLAVELVTIRRDAPVSLDLAKTRFASYDRQAVLDLFRELDFRALVDRLPAPSGEGGAESAAATPDGTYETVGSLAALSELAKRLRTAERICVDVETTSTDPMRAALVGIALSDKPGRGWYIPVGHGAATPAGEQGRLDLAGVGAEPNVSLDAVRAALTPVLTGDALKVAHNAKYDTLVLERHGLQVADPLFDTLIAAWLTEPGRRALGLKELAWSLLGVEMTPISDLIGTGRSRITMAQVPVADVAPYACADVDMTLRLADLLEPELESRGQRALFDDLEMPLLHVLVDMEKTGVLVDAAVLASISDELAERASVLEAEIFRAAGQTFNVGSTQQLAKVLFEDLGLPATRRTKTGYSTSAAALADIASSAPIVEHVLEWRHVNKLKSTYVDALPELINPDTGRIHTSWSQTSVVTGRLSSRDPNLQNIPVRSDVGGQIRRAFVAADGCVLLAADYSQMELRILASLSGDATLTEVFATGGDVHAATASFLFDKPQSVVTPNERRIAKMVNFGLLYGMGSYGLAQRTGLSQAEAAEFIDRYFATFSDVRKYFDSVLEQAAKLGYVETILGRRRYFPELAESSRVDRGARARAEREAINAPIQGSAADITKVAMLHLHRALREPDLESRMVLQVHDELVLEVPEDELASVADLTRSTMEDASDLSVRMEVDLSVGPNWANLVRYRS